MDQATELGESTAPGSVEPAGGSQSSGDITAELSNGATTEYVRRVPGLPRRLRELVRRDSSAVAPASVAEVEQSGANGSAAIAALSGAAPADSPPPLTVATPDPSPAEAMLAELAAYDAADDADSDADDAGLLVADPDITEEMATDAAQLSEPAVDAAEPVVDLAEPVVDAAQLSEPAVDAAEPVVDLAEPAVEAAELSEPMVEAAEPVADLAEPVADLAEPVVEVAGPVVEATEPANVSPQRPAEAAKPAVVIRAEAPESQRAGVIPPAESRRPVPPPIDPLLAGASAAARTVPPVPSPVPSAAPTIVLPAAVVPTVVPAVVPSAAPPVVPRPVRPPAPPVANTQVLPRTEPPRRPATAAPTRPVSTDPDSTGEILKRPQRPARPLQQPVAVRRPPKGRVRRVTRVIRHVDSWSVFKIAAVFNLFMLIVTLTAGVMLWQVAESTGTIDNVERGFENVGWEVVDLKSKGGEIFHNAWIAGLFVAVALTGLAVLMATLFNLITDLVGGVRVTVLQEEVRTRGEPQPMVTQANPGAPAAPVARTRRGAAPRRG